jgi:hypothetical protein
VADLNGDPGACGVCGRSMLAGERTRAYVSRDHERHEVCDLCVVRAESAGLVPAELAGTAAPDPGRRGAGRMRRLLDRARERAPSRSEGDASGERGADAGPARGDRPARSRRERPAARSGEEAPSQSTQRPRRHSVPQRPERRIRRGFESFNASSHRKTVGGLIRSLGGPWVSAVSPDEAPGEVRITVAWELSWYQWEVDLTADGLPVRELGHGNELSELAESDRAWNAHAAEDGELRPGLVESAKSAERAAAR